MISLNTGTKEVIIAGLRKQRDLLQQLISELKVKNQASQETRVLYDEITKQIEQNLKDLRKLKKEHFIDPKELNNQLHTIN